MDANFETGFALVEWWFSGQLSWFQQLGTLAGGLIVLAGFAVVLIVFYYRLAGEHVTLEVIRLHQEERQIDASDDDETIAEKRANPTMRLEFRVKDGPFVGTEAKASSAGSSVEHNVGDMVPGYILPSSKEVMSRAQTITGIKFGIVFASLGAGFILLVNFMTAQ